MTHPMDAWWDARRPEIHIDVHPSNTRPKAAA